MLLNFIFTNLALICNIVPSADTKDEYIYFHTQPILRDIIFLDAWAMHIEL